MFPLCYWVPTGIRWSHKNIRSTISLICVCLLLFTLVSTRIHSLNDMQTKHLKMRSDNNLQWRGWRTDDFSIEVFIRDFSKVSESMYSIVITGVCVIFTLSKSVIVLWEMNIQRRKPKKITCVQSTIRESELRLCYVAP